VGSRIDVSGVRFELDDIETTGLERGLRELRPELSAAGLGLVGDLERSREDRGYAVAPEGGAMEALYEALARYEASASNDSGGDLSSNMTQLRLVVHAALDS
jgi:hypothetical protein